MERGQTKDRANAGRCTQSEVGRGSVCCRAQEGKTPSNVSIVTPTRRVSGVSGFVEGEGDLARQHFAPVERFLSVHRPLRRSLFGDKLPLFLSLFDFSCGVQREEEIENVIRLFGGGGQRRPTSDGCFIFGKNPPVSFIGIPQGWPTTGLYNPKCHPSMHHCLVVADKERRRNTTFRSTGRGRLPVRKMPPTSHRPWQY